MSVRDRESVCVRDCESKTNTLTERMIDRDTVKIQDFERESLKK